MVDFTKEEKDAMVARLQAWFEEELNQDLGQFDAQFLMDFFAEQMGNYFYNQGLLDAQAILESRMDNITEAIDELVKPVN